jgi:aminoglycoside phosphotransferase (APT) family kinase protein
MAPKLVGSGRSADVYQHGDREVLRRYRSPRDTEREVAAMEHARLHGFPVPSARAQSDTDIVLERLSGPTMLDDLARRPWLIARHATTLARLHDQLHSIPAPGWLDSPVGDGDALLHLDLHPDNVLITPSGPMVIDWPNAARGPAASDVAHTWIVLASSLPVEGVYRRAVSRVGREAFLKLFLRPFDREALVERMETVGRYRLANRTLPHSELDAIRRLVERLAPSPR